MPKKKKIIKNDDDKCPIKSKEAELIEKYHKERKDNETLKNLLIFSDKDYTSSSAAEYFKIKGPSFFKKLFQEEEFKINENKSQTINKIKDINKNKVEIGKLYSSYYTELKKSLEINGWDYKKEEQVKDWRNELEYRYIVNYYFMYTLKNKESLLSWILIVISTIAASVSIFNSSIGIIDAFLTYSLTFLSISTSLLAAYMKKENYVERIKEIDRYTQKVGFICNEISTILYNDPWNRKIYEEFIDKHYNTIQDILSYPPPISPIEFKLTVYNLTKNYSELIRNKWPWFEKRNIGEILTYMHMTDWGRNVLISYKKYKYTSCFYKLFCNCCCFMDHNYELENWSDSNLNEYSSNRKFKFVTESGIQINTKEFNTNIKEDTSEKRCCSKFKKNPFINYIRYNKNLIKELVANKRFTLAIKYDTKLKNLIMQQEIEELDLYFLKKNLSTDIDRFGIFKKTFQNFKENNVSNKVIENQILGNSITEDGLSKKPNQNLFLNKETVIDIKGDSPVEGDSPEENSDEEENNNQSTDENNDQPVENSDEDN